MDFIACDIVIPGKIVRFLDQFANVAFAGTRDRDLVPFGHRLCGWRVGVDQRTMTILFPDEFVPRFLESLQQSGELAVTIEEFPSHETYQFKGHYLRHRQVLHGDVEIVDRIRQRFVKSMRTILADRPEDVLKAFVSPPALAIDFEVFEIFLQTPGPGAGTRLIPAIER
jgi:hypothetical protein